MTTIPHRDITTAPSDPWKPRSAIVRRLTRETADVFTVDLDLGAASPEAPFRYQPGQFNMLYVPGVGESAISISGHTQQGWVRHTIRAVGGVTQSIGRATVGTCLGVRGPFGHPWPVQQLWQTRPAPDVVVVAGGIGLAPLRALIHQLMAHRHELGRVHLLLGARTPQDLIFVDEFAAWREADLRLQISVDRGSPEWTGHIGVVTLLLERLELPAPESTWVMTCGPEVMMRYVAKSARERGILDTNMWVTLERNMNCAVGLCGHCQLGPHLLCRQGPVLRYDQVSAWLSVQGL